METYTVRNSKTGELIADNLVVWGEVEALLAKSADYEYLTREDIEN